MNSGPLLGYYFCEIRVEAFGSYGFITESFSARSWQYADGLFSFELQNGKTRVVNADKLLWLDIEELPMPNKAVTQ